MSFNRVFLVIVLTLGIAIRFYFQFLDPTINSDEVNVGLNIKQRSLTELFHPLDRFQSAPPLYLLTQKFFFGLVEPFWVSAKLFSFLVSLLVLFAATRLGPKLFNHVVTQGVFLLFFAFSPFIISQTLTIKQYGIDLLFVMLAMIGYERYRTSPVILPFFLVWTLFSNIGSFHVAGFLLYEAIRHLRARRWDIPGLLTANHGLYVKTMLTPIPYVLYYLWYIRQDGAQELKAFMASFYRDNFMPLDAGILNYILYFFHSLSVYFISSFHWIGYAGLLLLLAGGAIMARMTQFRGRQILLFGLCGILVHVVLNILRVYPMSDRFYLYYAPTVLFFLLLPLDAAYGRSAIRWLLQGFFIVTLSSYFFYVHFRSNNVPVFYRWMAGQAREKLIVLAPRAYDEVFHFDDFTDGYFNRGLSLRLYDSTMVRGECLIVSRSFMKFGHEGKRSPEESFIRNMLKAGRLRFKEPVGSGYHVYVLEGR